MWIERAPKAALMWTNETGGGHEALSAESRPRFTVAQRASAQQRKPVE
jgi:hypothetical protein